MNANVGSKPPFKLYKYRPTNEYTAKIFADHALHFAAPGSFNDPFDCNFHVLVDGAKNEAVTEANAWSEIRRRMPDLPLNEQIEGAKQVRERLLATRRNEFEQIVMDKLSKQTNERVGICCFTEVNDDILMWSHYADSHQGICLEFSSIHTPFQAAQPVEYSIEYPELDLEAVVLSEELRAAATWMLRKADHWSYEKEWRVIDFVGGPGGKPFQASCLTGVILGCRIPDEQEAKVRKWISDWPSTVTVYRARRSPTAFRLEIEQVP